MKVRTEVFTRPAKSKFFESYTKLLSEIQKKFNLTDMESKEIVVVISDWLYKINNNSEG